MTETPTLPLRSTSRFRMPHGQMAGKLFAMYAWPWIAAMGAMSVAAAVLGAILDLRYVIVALMIVCIVAPMLLALLYFNHGLHPASVVNVLPHTLSLGMQGIETSVWRLRQDDETEEEAEAAPPASVRIFPYSSLRPYTVGISSVTIPVAEGGFLWIPSSAFGRPSDFADFMQTLSDNIKSLKDENFKR